MNRLKSISISLIIVMFAILVVGCSKSSATSGELKEAPKTRTVSTVMGNVEVPENPKRIIINYFQGDLLALGIKPLASSFMEGETAFVNELKDVTVVEKWDPEEIMSLEPDLIIVIGEEEYEKFNKIAPTILIPFTEISTEERFNLIAEAVGKQEEAKKVLDDFNNKVEDSKKKLTEAGVINKTFTLVESLGEGSIAVFGNKWGRGGEILYDYLGLKAPEVIQKEIINGEQYRDVSLEVLPEYCGDYIIQSLWSGDDPFKDSELWKNIKAVKEDKLIKTDGALFYYMDLYSMDKQLDYIVNGILETVK